MNPHELETRMFFHTYKRLPLDIDRGEGVYLYTKDGRRYLDMFGGLAVNALGYGHARVLKAINDQANRYIHLSNYFVQDTQVQLAERLLTYTGYQRVLFTNSWTEAVEGAIKIARKWGSTNGKSDMLAFSNAFHGRTMGALSIMDRPKYREGYGPFLSNCSVVPNNDHGALAASVSERTAAIMLEFIQGEGGVRPVSSEMVRTLRELRDRFGFLLIADEIQSGVGRTGKFFGFQHYDINPDLVVIAKPIGGGLPLGAILGNSRVADVLQPGTHGTTFGGNPVACAAGLVVLEEIVDHGIIKNVETIGVLLKAKFRELQSEFPSLIRDVRGHGLMLGIDLTREGDSIVTAIRDHGILVNCTESTVLRFLPPLIITQEHVDEVIRVLRLVFSGLDVRPSASSPQAVSTQPV